MVKKNKHRFSLFCCLLIALLGFGACKQKKDNNNANQIKEDKTDDYEPIPCVYGPPPTYDLKHSPVSE